MKIDEILSDEIVNEVEILGETKVGTEEYKIAVDGITKLCDRAIEAQKLESELELKRIQHEDDITLKTKQMKNEKRDNIVKNCLTGAGIVLPLIVTVWGAKASIDFEKEGTFTTIMSRGFIQKLLPKK